MVTEEVEIDGYTSEQVGYHNYLIVDSGLAKGVDVEAAGDTSLNWQLLHLTSAGHDFADAARSETAWSRAKSIVKEKGATLEIFKEVLVSVIRGTLGLS